MKLKENGISHLNYAMPSEGSRLNENWKKINSRNVKKKFKLLSLVKLNLILMD
jgi:hypothetical protein